MSDTAGASSAILRDYLYVDVDKVKSIAGQLEEGVPEEARLTKKDGKKTSVGWEKFLNYSPESSEEDYIQRSMLDSLFPDLEEMLEGGWLEDVSELFASGEPDAFARLQERRPEGSIFRLTADGYLFDARHFSALFANMSAAMAGFQDMERAQAELAETPQAQPPKGGPKRSNQGRGGRDKDSSSLPEGLEGGIEEFQPQHGMSPALFRSFVRAARGVFSPGLHLLMTNGANADSIGVSMRFKEQGHHLDGSPELVASRFGPKRQRWTIVGTVGHYSVEPEVAGIANILSGTESAASEDFDRQRFVRTINNAIADMAKTGLIELPQHPGMAAIPIAVYRSMRGGLKT